LQNLLINSKTIIMKSALLLLSATALLFTSCSHESTRPIGGKGGNATVVVYPQHHQVAVTLDSMIVYVKYNAENAPLDGKYDDSATCTNTNAIPSCSFSGLTNGTYYFYSKGYDYNVASRVHGGIPYSVTSQQSQNINLPVSEEQH
jgi:hypothetical protein